MANKTAGKPKREIKTGKRGGPRTILGRRELILMGKGAVHALPPIKCSPWQGSSVVSEPFDAEQALKNKLAGLC